LGDSMSNSEAGSKARHENLAVKEWRTRPQPSSWGSVVQKSRASVSKLHVETRDLSVLETVKGSNAGEANLRLFDFCRGRQI
jgi:hypothetical protein